MNSSRATFLLRFDDLCPTANWDVWNSVERLLLERDVSPLVSVVPDNRDPTLQVAPPDPAFWERVRAWQARGWSIGLHGHDHVYRTRDPGLLGINARSEFAGLPLGQQRAQLAAALEAFARERVHADAWVAPAHSFDRATLRALRDLGVWVVSDGYFPSPHTDRDGMVWVPQQLWSLRARSRGAWTVCYHVNGWTDEDLRRFEVALDRFEPQIVALPAMVEMGRRRARGVGDAVFERYWRGELAIRARMGSLRSWLRPRTAELPRR